MDMNDNSLMLDLFVIRAKFEDVTKHRTALGLLLILSEDDACVKINWNLFAAENPHLNLFLRIILALMT